MGNCRPSKFWLQYWVLFALLNYFVSICLPLQSVKMSGIIVPLLATVKSKGESFYMGKFLIPTSDESDISILKSWLQNRLKEYFAKEKERDRRAKDLDYSPFLKFEDLDIFSQELRVLDVKYLPDQIDDENDSEVIKGMDCRSTDQIYETGVTRMMVTFQRDGPNSIIQTMNLVTGVGEILNLELVEALMHPYVPYSEKRLIDIYTTVFPMLEDWGKTRGIEIQFSIPTCYFAKYEDCKKMNLDFDHFDLTVNDDIMSKVGAGIALDKMDSEPTVIESHRILMMEDIHQNGFTRKNATASSFLPLLNIKTAIQAIVKIHATSWAFGQIEQKNFGKIWPIMAQKKHVSYILSQARSGLPIMISLVEDYLRDNKSKDFTLILQHLKTLESSLQDVLEKITIPTPTGPTTLIHQGLNFSSILFRHSYLPVKSTMHENKSESSSANNSKNRTVKHRFQAKSFTFNKPTTSHNKSSTSASLPLVKREVCITDWRNATIGSPMIDIAILLLSSLPPKARKSETASLLKFYWEEFSKVEAQFGLKSTTWPKKETLEEYNKGILYGCLIIASNVTSDSQLSEDDLEIFVEAVRELISLKLI